MQHFVPYTPQQNGVVERKNEALKDMGTCMMEAKDLNPKIWDEALKYYEYVQNKYSHKALDVKNPYEAWSGHKPNVFNFKVFG